MDIMDTVKNQYFTENEEITEKCDSLLTKDMKTIMDGFINLIERK